MLIRRKLIIERIGYLFHIAYLGMAYPSCGKGVKGVSLMSQIHRNGNWNGNSELHSISNKSTTTNQNTERTTELDQVECYVPKRETHSSSGFPD